MRRKQLKSVMMSSESRNCPKLRTHLVTPHMKMKTHQQLSHCQIVKKQMASKILTAQLVSSKIQQMMVSHSSTQTIQSGAPPGISSGNSMKVFTEGRGSGNCRINGQTAPTLAKIFRHVSSDDLLRKSSEAWLLVVFGL